MPVLDKITELIKWIVENFGTIGQIIAIGSSILIPIIVAIYTMLSSYSFEQKIAYTLIFAFPAGIAITYFHYSPKLKECRDNKKAISLLQTRYAKDELSTESYKEKVKTIRDTWKK